MSKEILKTYLPDDKPILEIGPLDRPFLKKEEYDVYYADVLGTEGLISLYRDDPEIDKDKIVTVDYILDGTYPEAVGEKRFQAVFSSNVIEHTLDLIGHFNEISEILAEGGRYTLCVPDKRYSFDFFREVTSFRDALDAHINGNKALKRLVFDYYLNKIPIYFRPKAYFLHSVSFEDYIADSNVVDHAKAEMESDGLEYVHFWVFTFTSFLAIIRDCLRLNLLPYTLEWEGRTMLGDCDFYIVLKKDTEILSDTKRRQMEIIRINKMIEHRKNRRPSMPLWQTTRRLARMFFLRIKNS